MRILISGLIAIVVLAVATVFATHNEQLVMVNYLIAKGEFKLSLVIGFSLVTGFLLSWIVSAFFYYRLKMRFTLLKRKSDKLEKQQDILADTN